MNKYKDKRLSKSYKHCAYFDALNVCVIFKHFVMMLNCSVNTCWIFIKCLIVFLFFGITTQLASYR